MAKNRYLAGVSTALLIDPATNALIGVAKTLTTSTFNFTLDNAEIRAGAGNALWGKYFYNSNLEVSLQSAMFDLSLFAASLGYDVKEGGLPVKEESVVAQNGKLVISEEAIPVSGSMVGWYKKPSDENWQVCTIDGKNMTVGAAKAGETYCVKYFYQNANARSMVMKVQQVPSILHVVLLNDLYSGGKDFSKDPIIGRLITDIPRLQMSGTQNLDLNTTSAATMSLTGMALAIDDSDSCDEDPYYGTMTEEIFGETWESRAMGLAIQDAEVELANGESETLIVRTLFANDAQIKDNSNYTFAIVDNTTNVAVVDTTGKVTAKGEGTVYVSVHLTKRPDIEPAYAKVTVG